MATISLRCKHCEGILDIEEGRDVLFCPYCGSKELIPESDTVKIERIRTGAYRDVELGKQDVAKEMQMNEYEYEKWKAEFEEEKRQREEKEGWLGVVGIFVFLLYMLFLLICLDLKRYFLLATVTILIVGIVIGILYFRSKKKK